MDISKIAKQLGSLGGKKSVESRFGGKTKEEVSDIMKNVRVSKKDQGTIRGILSEEQRKD